MGYFLFSLEVVVIFVLTAALLYYYSNFRTQNPVALFGVFVAWYFSFLIVFILPIDISSTAYRSCLSLFNSSTSLNQSTSSVCIEPWSFVAPDVLHTVWLVIYWSSLLLTWLILPLTQSYSNAANFTALGRLKAAVIENLLYYGSYLLLFGIFLIYLAVKPGYSLTWESLKVICITAGNTWGMLLLIPMLGYGMVAVPRFLLRNARPLERLNMAYFRLAKIHLDRAEAEDELNNVLLEVAEVDEKISPNNELRPAMDLIVSKCRSPIVAHGERC